MSPNANPERIETDFTRMIGIRYPIVCAPMFLVSNPELVAAVSNAGALGTIPAMNMQNYLDYSDHKTFERNLDKIFELTDQPFGINLTFKLDTNWRETFKYCMSKGVKVYLTSLGNPKEVVDAAHAEGGKVFCDVTNPHHALKAQDSGVDGVIAVASGAGGHAGPIDMMALIPMLKEALDIPVLAAGSIMDGRGMTAALSLGASAAYMGSRFIASSESGANEEYRRLMVESHYTDTEMSPELSGVPCRYFTKSLEKYRTDPSKFIPWVDIWSVGQGVGEVKKVIPAGDIVSETVAEYMKIKTETLPGA